MSADRHAVGADLPPFTELVPCPAEGRVFALSMRPGLGDCAPSGRIRLDGLARWLQDVAYADVEDAGVAEGTYWVVRRTRILVHRWPRFAERCRVSTFCSGMGRMWAERRTTVALLHGGAATSVAVEAVALWVHLDPASRRPVPFSPREIEAYGDAAASRKITARLRHPSPDPGLATSASGPHLRDRDPELPSRSWTFRPTDCDIAGHVNNAAYWQALEGELLADPEEPAGLDAEMEFRAGAQPGEVLVRGAGPWRWVLDASGQVLCSAAIGAAEASPGETLRPRAVAPPAPGS